MITIPRRTRSIKTRKIMPAVAICDFTGYRNSINIIAMAITNTATTAPVIRRPNPSLILGTFFSVNVNYLKDVLVSFLE